MSVTPEFKEASTRAAIRGLRGLEQTAIMLETYAPEIFPETTEVNGVVQKHFGRVMMECAAKAIRDAFIGAVVEVERFPDDPANLIDQYGKQRQTLLEIATLLQEATPDPAGLIPEAHRLAKAVLNSNLVQAHPSASESRECPSCHQPYKDGEFWRGLDQFEGKGTPVCELVLERSVTNE